jgi:hypothetical protein
MTYTVKKGWKYSLYFQLAIKININSYNYKLKSM